MCNRLIIALLLYPFLLTLSPAQTVEELQTKLAAAQNEIDALKLKLSKAQSALSTGKSPDKLPPVRADVLSATHPILSAYEFSVLAADPTIDLKALTKGKVISLTGSVQRFSDGVGRGFTVFLDPESASKEVACQFYPGTDVTSVHTQDDGAELIIDHRTRGTITLASVQQKVIVSGFYRSNKRGRVSLDNCVLQAQ